VKPLDVGVAVAPERRFQKCGTLPGQPGRHALCLKPTWAEATGAAFFVHGRSRLDRCLVDLRRRRLSLLFGVVTVKNSGGRRLLLLTIVKEMQSKKCTLAIDRP